MKIEIDSNDLNREEIIIITKKENGILIKTDLPDIIKVVKERLEKAKIDNLLIVDITDNLNNLLME